MGAKKWEKSSTMPDWTDIWSMMRAIEELHGVFLTLTLTSTVLASPGGILAIAAYSMPNEASVMGSLVTAISGEWPCKEHADITTCVFAGLYALDSALCSKLWRQLNLPFTAT